MELFLEGGKILKSGYQLSKIRHWKAEWGN